jgi:hypothetical protein
MYLLGLPQSLHTLLFAKFLLSLPKKLSPEYSSRVMEATLRHEASIEEDL